MNKSGSRRSAQGVAVKWNHTRTHLAHGVKLADLVPHAHSRHYLDFCSPPLLLAPRPELGHCLPDIAAEQETLALLVPAVLGTEADRVRRVEQCGVEDGNAVEAAVDLEGKEVLEQASRFRVGKGKRRQLPVAGWVLDFVERPGEVEL